MVVSVCNRNYLFASVRSSRVEGHDHQNDLYAKRRSSHRRYTLIVSSVVSASAMRIPTAIVG